MTLSSKTIGQFVDSKAGNIRQPKDVAGRLIEEVAELCLCAGLTSGEIMAHIADALHNQCLKQSIDTTVFPSQVTDKVDALPDEIADVSIILKDLAYLSNTDINKVEKMKWEKFIRKTFKVSEKGTLYAIKPHIK